jgi:GntR family transcriptional repressor for pyruvate dehydrogenase complex
MPTIDDPETRKPERLADQLYGQILKRIVSGELEAGEKLPSENSLCRSHGVSRPVVREALLRLQADGLVYSRQGVGSFVKRRPPKGLIEFARPSDVAAVLRCFEVRIALEGAIARLAAERGTPREVAAIGHALESLKEAMHGRGSAPEADFDFHLAVAQAASNDFFVGVLTTLQAAIGASMEVALSLTRRGSPERSQRVYDEHVAIYEAIVAHDPESAELAMRYHLHRARQRITDNSRDR